jgi:transposase InsO family protein
MGRENLRMARCGVRRLMRELGLVSAARGLAWTTKTQAQPKADRPGDLVDRHITATRPNQLCLRISRTWPRGAVSSMSFVIYYICAAHRRLTRVPVERNPRTVSCAKSPTQAALPYRDASGALTFSRSPTIPVRLTMEKSSGPLDSNQRPLRPMEELLHFPEHD